MNQPKKTNDRHSDPTGFEGAGAFMDEILGSFKHWPIGLFPIAIMAILYFVLDSDTAIKVAIVAGLICGFVGVCYFFIRMRSTTPPSLTSQKFVQFGIMLIASCLILVFINLKLPQ